MLKLNVRCQVHVNGLENFWSLFKRALKGTYASVEPYHSQAYADEQCVRVNERKMNDFEHFALTMKQIVGRPNHHGQARRAGMRSPLKGFQNQVVKAWKATEVDR